MVLRGLVDHLEFNLLLSEVCWSAEDDIEMYRSQWIRRLPWDDSVEGSLCWQEIVYRDLDLSQCIRVDEVQAAASVHEHLFRGETPYLRLENQGVVSWACDLRRVI